MEGAGTALRALLARAGDGVLLADGATGTALQQRGLRAGECPETWNLSHPDAVQAIAAAYAAAGSQLVYTNTFGANGVALRRHGLQERMAELNTAAVHLARAGVGPGVAVAGSIGPTGALLEPLGDLTAAEAGQAFAEQAAALVAAGVDALVLETFSHLPEALAGLRAVRGATAGPVVVSLSFEARGRTVMGVSAEEGARALTAAGADALGANCGGAWDGVALALAGLARSAPGVPLLLKPNAGTPRATPTGSVYPEGPETFAAFVAAQAARWPVRIAGGCCGTGPEHIAALRRSLSRGAAARGAPDGRPPQAAD